MLENLYKLFHTSGVIPDDQQIRRAFNDYFSINKAGFPLRIDLDVLRASAVTDVEILNSIMANSIFNIDVIFDAIFENNDQLLGTINALNKKIENLRKKRAELESKIDDILFANSNTDGFFYSFSENFSSLTNSDLDLTSAYINTSKKNVELSAINSLTYSDLSVSNIIASNASASLSINGAVASNSVDMSLFSNIFDGLTDTYWVYDYNSKDINSISLSINIPISNNIVISKIEGIVHTTSPVNIFVSANYSDVTKQSETRVVNSTGDYGTFTVSVPPNNYSSIDIILFKIEPDQIISNSSSPYRYKFGLRELVIGSKYYDKNGIYVSKAISIPSSDNKNLFIDAVAIDVVDQKNSNTNIEYYVAEDVPGATSVSDFSWEKIYPSDSSSVNESAIVSFSGSSRQSVSIKSAPSPLDLQLIPENPSAKNADEVSPTSSLYPGKTVYRVATLNKQIDYLNPSLYANADAFKHYYYVLTDVAKEYYKDLTFWSTEIQQNKANILNSLLKEQLGSLYPGVISPTSGYIQTKLLSQNDQKLIFTVSKTNYNFNLAIYLNGELIADLPKGVTSKSVEWNFSQGVNNIIITYDKPFSGVASFSLMEGTKISNYGSVFVDYFYFLDPFDFANKQIETENYFTIDTLFGSKQIFASQKIEGVAKFGYTIKSDRSPSAIRFRADLTRYENPYSTPVLENFKIKFKHSSV